MAITSTTLLNFYAEDYAVHNILKQEAFFNGTAFMPFIFWIVMGFMSFLMNLVLVAENLFTIVWFSVLNYF